VGKHDPRTTLPHSEEGAMIPDLTAQQWKALPESARFWLRVDIRPGDECWEWLGRVNNMGYGRFITYQGNRETKHYAHRYALRSIGRLDESLVVLHACDNPKCVNPAHLSQGTQADNMRDALAKGRLNLSGLAIGHELKRAANRGRFCECGKPAKTLGMCNAHYQRAAKLRRKKKAA
jgi:hypothetical protein